MKFEFYSPNHFKPYNLTQQIRYTLNLLDRLDNVTRTHSENVANITYRLCEYLGYQEKDTVFCTICAYLHDIGKLMIPPHILQKQTALTEAEYEVMKTHAEEGYRICIKDSELAPYGNGARSHHESPDGTGYPHGLLEDEIPMEGQIIKVADVYDALVSKRQYKTHIDISEAIKMMAEDTKNKKLNKHVMQALKLVVIDDIAYEILQLQGYLNYIAQNINRLEQVKRLEADSLKPKLFHSGEEYQLKISALLQKEEDRLNYLKILEEYQDLSTKKQEQIKSLQEEIKKVKKISI